MDTKRAEDLRRKIQEHEKKVRALKEEIGRLEGGGSGETRFEGNVREDKGVLEGDGWKWPLEAEEYERYGRQLVIPSVGVKGQLRLKNASVLIIGAGGLGCPAAAYIAGAGVGRIGLVDGDKVEASNLHRQIAHTTLRVGVLKVDSAVAYLKELNPKPQYVPYRENLTPENAESIIAGYDIVLDCTDHPTSRYLISDVCVLLRKPLVSASAFRTDGQLIVLNTPALERGDPAGGPCYRCVFPKPPPANTVVSCGEGGILGPVVGTMGVLQALETIRLIAAGMSEPPSKGEDAEEQQTDKPLQPTLLLFSATTTGPSFRSVRMRGRRPGCYACGSDSPLTLAGLQSGGVDYVRFCGVTGPVSVLDEHERISASEYQRRLAERGVGVGEDHVLLDVREKEHFGIASIPGAVNIPYSSFMSASMSPAAEEAGTSAVQEQGKDDEGKPEWLPDHLPLHAPIYVICRVGNDSQLVTRRLKEMGLDGGGERFIGDIRGGMKAWKEEVDETLPFT